MKNIFKKLGFTCLGIATCGTASSLITSTNAQQVAQTMTEIKVNDAIEANKPLIDNAKDKLATLKEEIDKNIFKFDFESSNGIHCSMLTKPLLNKDFVIEFFMPEGQTRVNELKVMCGNEDITNLVTLSYSTCRIGFITIPKNAVKGDIKLTIASTKNQALTLINDDPQTICLVNNPSYNDGSDLVLEYQVEEGQLFCAEATGKRIGDDVYSSIKADAKKSDKSGIWNVIISADELSSIEELHIKTRNALKGDSLLEVYEKIANEGQLAKNNEDLRGYDWSKGQTSPYHEWVDKQYNEIKESYAKNNIPFDHDKFWDLRNWAYDNGKEVKQIVDKQTQRKNRLISSEASKTEPQLRYNYFISPNYDQKTIGLFKNDSEKQNTVVNYNEFNEIDSKKDEIAGNVSYETFGSSVTISSGKHKEGRHLYLPFKIELSGPMDLDTVYNLFPTMTIDYTVHSNFKAFYGHRGNHFLTQLYYFGEGEKAKDIKPESFDADYVDKDPSKWDKNVIWREHFYKGGDHDTEKGLLRMNDRNNNIATVISKDKTKTLYFGLYVAAKSRPNKHGALGYEIRLNPTFSDKNAKLNITQGKEFYQQSKYFERNCEDENKKEDFSLKNDLANDKAIPQERIHTGLTNITISGFSKNMNLRGLYLPVNNTITLPAHTKAKVNIGMQSLVSFNRKKSINVWDTRIQDYSSFFNINSDVVKNYFEKNKINDILIPAGESYADDKNSDKMVNDILKGCEKFTMKIKGQINEVLVIAICVITIVVCLCSPLFAIIEHILGFIFGALTVALFAGIIGGVAIRDGVTDRVHIETVDFIKDEQSRGFVQSKYKEKIVEDIILVNDTDEDKTYTFEMAYSNLLEGERHREKPIACDYHISSIVKISDVMKI